MSIRIPFTEREASGTLANVGDMVAAELAGFLSGFFMTNPMTALGDIIIGDTGGVPKRLPIGPAGFVLGSSGTQVVWVAAGGGGTPAAPAGSIQFNNAGAFGAVPNWGWDGNYLHLNNGNVGSAVQVYYNLLGDATKQNVPFRIDSTSDVNLDLCGIAREDSSFVVSTNPLPRTQQVTPFNPALNYYFGIRSTTNLIAYICLGDGAGFANTIYLGSDGTNKLATNMNKVFCGNLALTDDGGNSAFSWTGQNAGSAPYLIIRGDNSGGLQFQNATVAKFTEFFNAGDESLTWFNHVSGSSSFRILGTATGGISLNGGTESGTVVQLNSTAVLLATLVADFNTLLTTLRAMKILHT
jgi:hypothetical protein